MDLLGKAKIIAQKYGIPPELFCGLIKAESSWDPGAVSPVGAIGLTQVMPSTAFSLGISPEALKRDPELQMEVGAYYLGELYKKFASWRLALAAYNAGPHQVEKYGGIPPFRETEQYVENVFKYAREGAEPPQK